LWRRRGDGAVRLIRAVDAVRHAHLVEVVEKVDVDDELRRWLITEAHRLTDAQRHYHAVIYSCSPSHHSLEEPRQAYESASRSLQDQHGCSLWTGRASVGSVDVADRADTTSPERGRRSRIAGGAPCSKSSRAEHDAEEEQANLVDSVQASVNSAHARRSALGHA
jgi:hypothetical protein